MAQILIADDDALIGEVVSHRLQENGHVVAVVDNGAKVLEMVQRERPDIVILDILMPGLRGIEVLAQLQKEAITASIPVLMLTGQTGRNHMVEAYDAGATDFMTKPFKPESLVERIDSIISSAGDRPMQVGQFL